MPSCALVTNKTCLMIYDAFHVPFYVFTVHLHYYCPIICPVATVNCPAYAIWQGTSFDGQCYVSSHVTFYLLTVNLQHHCAMISPVTTVQSCVPLKNVYCYNSILSRFMMKTQCVVRGHGRVENKLLSCADEKNCRDMGSCKNWNCWDT